MTYLWILRLPFHTLTVTKSDNKMVNYFNAFSLNVSSTFNLKVKQSLSHSLKLTSSLGDDEHLAAIQTQHPRSPSASSTAAADQHHVNPLSRLNKQHQPVVLKRLLCVPALLCGGNIPVWQAQHTLCMKSPVLSEMIWSFSRQTGWEKKEKKWAYAACCMLEGICVLMCCSNLCNSETLKRKYFSTAVLNKPSEYEGTKYKLWQVCSPPFKIITLQI